MSDFQEMPASEGEVKPLGSFETTDPLQFNPKNFRFVVHSLGDLAMQSIQSMKNLMAAKEGDAIERQADPYDNTEAFLKRRFISCSVVDQDHTAMMNDSALIMNVGEQNVEFTSSMDAGTSAIRAIEDQRYKRSRIKPFDQVLRGTFRGTYNEVVINGAEGKPPISIQGGVILTNSEGIPLQRSTALKVRQIIESQGLPPESIIYIKTDRQVRPDLLDQTKVMHTGTYRFRQAKDSGILGPQGSSELIGMLNSLGKKKSDIQT